MTNVPDLLYPDAALWLDTRALRQALTFAFATGGTAESFSKIWERASFHESDFAEDCFAKELFLSDFVARCFPLKVGGQKYQPERGHLARLFAQPPRDPRVTAYRHAILRELEAEPEHAHALGKLAAKIRQTVLKL